MTASILSRVPFLAPLPDAELQALEETCRVRRFRRGEILFHEQDPGTALYLIRSGQVKIVRVADSGEETILEIVGPRGYLGELSLIDGQPRSTTAVALEPVEALTLGRDAFLALVERHPPVALAIMSGLVGMIRRLTDQVQDAVSLDVPGRVAKKLLELADRYGEPTPEGIRIALPLTQEELAQMIGVTRVSVNRYLGWFQERGALSVERQSITLHDPEQLRKRIY